MSDETPPEKPPTSGEEQVPPASDEQQTAPASDEQLSQDEVQALLRGVEDGDVVPAEGAPPSGDVQPYDLVGENRFAGQRFQALELAQDRLARKLERSLAAFVGTPPEMSVGKPNLLRYSTFRNRLESPASLHLFTMTPLRGHGVVVLSPQLTFGVVDRFFGGPGHVPEDLVGRAASTIELQLLQRLVGTLLDDLAVAWAPLQKIAFTYARAEGSLASVALADPSDAMLLLPLECELASGPAPLTIAMPFAALEPLRSKLGEPQAASGGRPDGEWRRLLAAVVHASHVTVAAELGTRDVSARQVLRWRTGDVLALDAASDDPLGLSVEGVRLMTGVPGVSRGSNAVRILGRSE